VKATTIDQDKPKRLSMVDNAWLHMEMPTNLMMVGSLVFFDAPFDREQLLVTLRQRLLNHPRFVQRIEASPVGTPRWVPDRMFDLNAHAHSVALPDAHPHSPLHRRRLGPHPRPPGPDSRKRRGVDARTPSPEPVSRC
jgi:hypothetical protein